jgi:hypothetical protein
MQHGTPLLPPIAMVGKSFKSTETTKPAQYLLEKRYVLTTKYNICTFIALLITP